MNSSLLGPGLLAEYAKWNTDRGPLAGFVRPEAFRMILLLGADFQLNCLVWLAALSTLPSISSEATGRFGVASSVSVKLSCGVLRPAGRMPRRLVARRSGSAGKRG